MPLSAGETSADREMLLSQAGSIQKELAQRVAQLTALADGFNASTATAEEKRTNALARLAIVFGKSFVVLPRFAAANIAELQKALNESEKAQDGDPLASTTWFQRMARVRSGIARLNQALSYAEAIGSGEKLSFSIAQLPYVAGDRWVGLPLKDGRTLSGRQTFSGRIRRAG